MNTLAHSSTAPSPPCYSIKRCVFLDDLTKDYFWELRGEYKEDIHEVQFRLVPLPEWPSKSNNWMEDVVADFKSGRDWVIVTCPSHPGKLWFVRRVSIDEVSKGFMAYTKQESVVVPATVTF